ncbi:MAG TPA: YggS family pyridoxal phosphate-dependent enzyme [Candidatus Methylacidiphilales bacterium]|jgi:pyridoxal phosphate enzyme (YggS family)|nr:YggS family pyridoxal phosphate-dependent enzyme [Candidatus Methylacidiphilales bacterium]
MDNFPSRLAKIHDAIATAAHKAGRDPAEIELLAVTKTQPADVINEAIRSGITRFGENKVQEARGKIEELGRGVWHLIGHLQSNKVRDAVRLFDSIDSVDRADLAAEIDHRAGALGKIQNVLLQVNIAGESTKFGCAPDAARALAEAINAMPRLCLRGLMTIAPYSPEPEKSRPHFAALRRLRDQIETSTGLSLPVLSMGMSGDFTVAIEEGGTCVRIGTALFGERLKLKQRRPEDPSFTEST